jgi:hypothetical protein
MKRIDAAPSTGPEAREYDLFKDAEYWKTNYNVSIVDFISENIDMATEPGPWMDTAKYPLIY